MPQNIVADEHHSRPRASPARSCLHQSHANSGPLSNSPAPSPNQLLSASSSQSQLVPPPSFYVAVPPLGQRTALLAPGNTAQLFDASSDNTVSDSNIKVAGRDLINLSVSINALLPSHTPGQQASETANQSSYLWPSILSRFWSPFSGTSVTLDPAESSATMDASYEPQLTRSSAPNCPDPRDAQVPDIQDTPATHACDFQACGGAYRESQAGGPEPVENTGSDDFDIISLEDLDINGKHRAKLFPPKSLNLSKASNVHEIYVKNITPSGHGYPCANPCPMGPPIRIGDVGIFTSSGFAVATNLYDCQVASLQNHLMSLPPLSDVWHNASYLSEGDSMTGGVSDCQIIFADNSSTIREIIYPCHDSEGAILAVTSPAQLLSLKDHTPLRDWLCDHGMTLFQSLRSGRADPLYVVTGTVTSSSWATATYAEPMKAPYDSVVLTHLMPQGPSSRPSYRWTRTGKAQVRSGVSVTIDPTGERAKDQCLFLRGFLLTPSTKHTTDRVLYGVRSSDGKATLGSDSGTGDRHSTSNGFESAGGGGLRSSSFSTGSHRGGASDKDVIVAEPVRGPEYAIVEEVPSLTSTELYPSYRINKQLLELTNADLAITHDDDWRSRWHDIQQQSMMKAKGSGVLTPSFLSEDEIQYVQSEQAQLGSTATAKRAEGMSEKSDPLRDSPTTQERPDHTKLAQASMSRRSAPDTEGSLITARGSVLAQDDAIPDTSGTFKELGRCDLVSPSSDIIVQSNTLSSAGTHTLTLKGKMMADVSTNTHTQAPRHSSASTVATMLADADLAITHDDDLSFGVQGVKRNAQAQPLASSPNVDPQLIKALESKDRIYMLKLAEQMESLINGKRSRIDLTPTTPSQRLLVHQCSAYYKLTAETDPATKNCFVQLTPDSRIPERRMSELVSPEPVSQPALNVLRRSQGDRRYKTYSRAASVAGDLADVKHSLARSLGFGGRSSTPGSSKKPMSIQEREAAYNEARSRIFMGFEEKEKEKAKEKDMSASASSLSLTYPPASNASGDSLGDLDGSITSPVTDSEWSDPSGQHSRDRKDHNRRGNASASSSTRSMRSGYHGDHSNPSSRNSRAPSPSFKYAPLYEPAPSQQLYDPNQPPNQTNAPYGTQYYHLFAPAPQGYAPPYNAGWYPPPGYPTPHNPHHPPPDPSRPIEHYPSPQMGYPHMWHPPNQPPPIQTSPLGQPGPMQHHQTHAHPAASPPPQPPAQYPYGQPPGQYPYGAPAGFGRPTPGYYPPTPPQGQPPMAQPSHPSAQMAIPGHLYDGSPAPHHGPPQPPGPQPNSGHGNKGRNNAAIARNPWSYGPGIGNGPRLTSARRQSNLSGGSSRASSYSDDGLSTSSSSTTTSSSSRRTYTTTASSQHPLPPRPDWAVGLKAQPTLARGSHEHNSPRNPMSPARGMSGDGRHPPPVLQPTDFPPLSSGPSPEKRHPVPSGAWGNSGNRAILVPPPSSAGGAVDGERNLSNPSPKVDSHKLIRRPNGNDGSPGQDAQVNSDSAALAQQMQVMSIEEKIAAIESRAVQSEALAAFAQQQQHSAPHGTQSGVA